MAVRISSNPTGMGSLSAQILVAGARAAMESTRRVAARLQADLTEGEMRDRIMKRVDKLVRGMETLAQRIASEEVSSTQRSVLVSRLNDLQRQINRIDGIVGSEGREVKGQESLSKAMTESRDNASPDNREIRIGGERLQEQFAAIAAKIREAQPEPREIPLERAPQRMPMARQLAGTLLDLQA